MGGCIGTHREGRNTSAISSESGSNTHGVSVGKNHPLRHERIRWKSDIPLTDGQLRSKRDEFWDTAPAFGGRKEIWDALKAASTAAENSDYELAKAILDGASVSMPSGTLTECYDELGNRYQLPVYCLSYPTNIIKETDDQDSPSECSETISVGSEVVVKVRMSTTGKDSRLTIGSQDNIAMAKRRLQAQEGIDASRQRWYFGGKLLGEKLKIEEAKIPSGYVVQVVVSPGDVPRIDS